MALQFGKISYVDAHGTEYTNCHVYLKKNVILKYLSQFIVLGEHPIWI